MGDVREFHDAQATRPRPFAVRSLGEFEGKAVPERDWLVPSVLIRRSISLFAGDGGVGKSLAVMQLQVACALGQPWLGIDIPKQIPSFGYYCEDDTDELHRRFSTICAFYGCSFADIGDKVRFISRVGENDNELVSFRGKSGDLSVAKKTTTFAQLQDEIEQWGSQLIIIDTASDVFAGNENVRYQVKSFVTILRGLALINNGGIILNAHPSKSAMADGSGFSGSTAWNGAVRNRLYLSTPKRRPVEEDDGPTDDRVLKVMKSNYGPFGEKIKCRWQSGVFVRVEGGTGSLIDVLTDNARILKGAEYLVSNGSRISADNQTRTGLATLVRNLPSCRDLSWKAVCNAQDRMLETGHLVKVELGPPSKRRLFVRPSYQRYPGEKEPAVDQPTGEE